MRSTVVQTQKKEGGGQILVLSNLGQSFRPFYSYVSSRNVWTAVSVLWIKQNTESNADISGVRTSFSVMTNCSVCVVQRGVYLPQTYMVQEEMVVTGRVKNMRQLGPFIHRLCYGKETFRLKRRNSRRRESTYIACLSCTRLSSVLFAWCTFILFLFCLLLLHFYLSPGCYPPPH